MQESTQPPQSLPTPDFNQPDDYHSASIATTNFDWNIITFFKKSILLVKNHPKLLILGVALTVFSASSVSSSQTNFQNLINDDAEEIDQGIQQEYGFDEINLDFQQLEKGLVKGISTATESQELDSEQTNLDISALTNFLDLNQSSMQDADYDLDSLDLPGVLDPALAQNQLSTLLLKFSSTLKVANRRIPGWVYSFLGLEILIALIFGIAFSFIVSAWSQAAVIEGIHQADQAGNNADGWQLVIVSKKAFTHIKAMIWLNIFPWLKLALQFMSLFVAIGLIFGLGLLMGDDGSSIQTIIIMTAIIGSIAFTIWFILRVVKTFFSIILGQRQLVLNSLKAKPAFKQGWLLLKGNYWKTYWLFIANLFFNLLINLIVIAPLMAVVIGFIAKNWGANTLAQLGQSINIGWIIATIATISFLIVASTFVRVVMQVISNANWHWAHQVLTANRNQHEQ